MSLVHEPEAITSSIPAPERLLVCPGYEACIGIALDGQAIVGRRADARIVGEAVGEDGRIRLDGGGRFGEEH